MSELNVPHLVKRLHYHLEIGRQSARDEHGHCLECEAADALKALEAKLDRAIGFYTDSYQVTPWGLASSLKLAWEWAGNLPEWIDQRDCQNSIMDALEGLRAYHESKGDDTNGPWPFDVPRQPFTRP